MIRTRKRTSRMYNTWMGGIFFSCFFFGRYVLLFPLFLLFFCSTGIETFEEFYFVREPGIGQYKFDMGEEIREEAIPILSLP